MFRASSTLIRLESNKIFRVHAVALLRVQVRRRIGASRCRFNVSTAFRGSHLPCFVHKPTCFDHNVLVIVSHVLRKVQQDAAKDGLGLLLVAAELHTIMLVSFVPRFGIKDKNSASERSIARQRSNMKTLTHV
jgi:hypothetical protein